MFVLLRRGGSRAQALAMRNPTHPRGPDGKTAARGFVLVLALTQGACLTHIVARNDAVNTFSAVHPCPQDRLTTRSVVAQAQEIFERGTPPAEVAADPGRLRTWTKNSDARMANYSDLTVVDIAGCGAHETYVCWFERNDGDDGVHSVCRAVNLDDPHGKAFQGFRLKPSAWPSLRQRLDSAR
jgi:hypothetical protein